MNKLVETLNALFEKYDVSDKEVAEVQDLIAKIESDNEDEFTYEEKETEDKETEDED